MSLKMKVFIRSMVDVDENAVITEERTLATRDYVVPINCPKEFKEYYSEFVSTKESLQWEWDMYLMGIDTFHIYTYNDSGDAEDFHAFIATKQS